VPLHVLQIERAGRSLLPKSARPTIEADRARDGEDAIAEELERQDRLGRPRLLEEEGHERGTPSTISAIIGGAPQA